MNNTKIYTALVVPAFSDQAAQLKIVCKEGDGFGLSEYRRDPSQWFEIGKCTAGPGRIVCLDAPEALYLDMLDCEPLRPPLTFTFQAAYPGR